MSCGGPKQVLARMKCAVDSSDTLAFSVPVSMSNPGQEPEQVLKMHQDDRFVLFEYFQFRFIPL